MNRILAPIALFAVLAVAPAQAQITDMRGWAVPGLYFYLVQPQKAWLEGSLGAAERPVRGGLELTFVDPARPSAFVYRPPAPVFAAREGWAGVCLWYKGDGSDGIGVLGIGEGGENDPQVMFSLRDKTWQPLRRRWEDFNPPVRSTSVASLYFTVTADTKRPRSYLVGRLELIRSIEATRSDADVRAGLAKASAQVEVERPKDLSPFIAGADRFHDFRAELDAKRPKRVLVLGDAVATGVALWDVPPIARPRVLFPGRLEAALKAKSPGSSVATVIVDGPETASGPLLAALRTVKPDVVVIEFSCSPPGVPLGAEARVKKAVRGVLDICRKAGVEPLVLPVPPLADDIRRVDYGAALFDAAGEAKVPVIDFAKFAEFRAPAPQPAGPHHVTPSPPYQGEYYASPDTLNVEGHAAAAQLLQSVLVNP